MVSANYINKYYQNNAQFNGVKSYNDKKNKKNENITDSIEDSVNGIIDKVTNQNTKHSTRIAIVSSSIAVGVVALATLLNPRYSQKFANKLKNLEVVIKSNTQKSQDSFIKSKFYKFSEKCLNWVQKTIEFTCNVNSIKDIAFKNLSIKKASCSSSDSFIKKIGVKIKNGFVAIGRKPHEFITKIGEKLAESTVKRSCKNAVKKCEKLENVIKMFSENMSPFEKVEIEKELQVIKLLKRYYFPENIHSRLLEQEKLMDGLEEKTMEKFKNYCRGLKPSEKGKGQHIVNNLNFWAQEILRPNAEKVNEKGLEHVHQFVGKGKNANGAFDRIMEILRNSENIKQEEIEAIEKSLRKFEKALNNAHNTECVDYFAKKKDLLLGSAPTDIVSTLFFSALAGISIMNSDDKEERISKTMTKALPIMLGACANVGMTSLLYSGAKGALAAVGTTIGTSKIGSVIDEKVFGHEYLSKKDKRLAKRQAKKEV